MRYIGILAVLFYLKGPTLNEGSSLSKAVKEFVFSVLLICSSIIFYPRSFTLSDSMKAIKHEKITNVILVESKTI